MAAGSDRTDRPIGLTDAQLSSRGGQTHGKSMTVIGVDFGTTNSVVTMLHPDGSVATARHAFGAAEMDVIRSVLCFWNDGAKDRIVLRNAIGPAAIEAYLDDPLESRLMMSLKSYLAQRSFTETRVFGRPFTLEALIGLFLGAILPKPTPDTVLVAGRPVRFAGDSPDDSFGEQRLCASYAAAGWAGIQTALEPEAAGYRFERGLKAPATVLIGDFGGGTSDFSVLRFEPGSNHPVRALGHAGVGIAGDTFDYRIVDQVVSPRLGKGTTYRPGGTDLPVPPEYYSSFARWHRLSLMRAPKTMRDIEAVARTAMYPDRLHALLRLIRDELGYELYRTVSGVKAELSLAEKAVLRFRHADFAIEETIARRDFEHWIAPDIARIAATVDVALAEAGLTEGAIDRVFLTGGTSLVPAVRRLFTNRFGPDQVMGGGEFVSVAEGLALIGSDRQRH
ncbi:MAG: putative chaperone protein [Acetobacteraceae bacterium]|nr:putative chaperone protein [Acetobacteraceae bacterium]